MTQKKKAAFTLAEVLITLGIIGVVAAMTLPAFLTNVQDRVKAKRIENINQKLSKSTDKMLALSGVMGYGSTMDYVTELKKHYNIVKVCDNDSLRGCWPYDKVLLSDGTEWNIADTKTKRALKLKNGDGEEWDDTVGIVTNDGTNMILSYNKKCSITTDNLPKYDKTTGKSTSTNCMAAVYDWNGGSKPNKFSDDVIAFNANGLGTSCVIELDDNTCFSAPFTPEKPLTKAQCEAKKDDLNIQNCADHDYDYWAAAVQTCGGTQNMPTLEDLGKLASKLYVGNPSVGAKEEKPGLTFDTSAASSMGFTGYSAYELWSGEERNSSLAYYRVFRSTNTGWHWDGRAANYALAVCLVD